MRFFKHLLKTWKFENNVVIVLDRHPCHDVQEVQDLLERANITVLTLPTASSPLNPVEQVWAALKRHWATTVVALDGNVDMTNFEGILDQCIKTQIQGNCSKYADSVFRVFSSVLEGKLV